MQTSLEPLPAPDVIPAPSKYGYFTLFSPRGRMGRAQLFYVVLLANIGSSLGETVVTASENAPNIFRMFTAISVITLSLLNVAVIILSSIKRVHDWGKSGVHTLKILIPFYSLVMIFRDGDIGLNFYGERRYNPHIYWNAPLVVLVPMLLMLAFAFGVQALADLAASAPGTRYQDDRNGYTVTVPAGWTREPLEEDADTMQFFSPDKKYGMYVAVRSFEDAPGYTWTEVNAQAMLDSLNIEDLYPEGYHAFGEVITSVEQVGVQWLCRMESNGMVDESHYRIVYIACGIDGYYYGLFGEQYGRLTQAQKDRMDAFMRSFRAKED